MHVVERVDDGTSQISLSDIAHSDVVRACLNQVSDVERVSDIARALHARFTPERSPQIAPEPPSPNRPEHLDAIQRRHYGPRLLNHALSYVPRSALRRRDFFVVLTSADLFKVIHVDDSDEPGNG